MAQAARIACVLALAARPVRAAEDGASASDKPQDADSPANPAAAEERNREKYREQLRAIARAGSYVDLFSTVMFGDGLRFNNPYRLSYQLGKTGESLSATAPYLDLAVVVTTGNPDGLQHGARFSWSFALTGIPQNVLTPSYAAVLRPGGPWLLYGWLGVPIVTGPDFVVGGELAAGATYLARAGLGATFAIVGDGFYGAGTRETRAVFYPVLSAQLGLSISYEVLP